MNIEGIVAVITGGASGIGRATAHSLAKRGASAVVIADVNEERIAETVSEIESLGSASAGVRCDVRSDEDWERLRDSVFGRFGRADLLFNNAGVALLGPPQTMDIPSWEWLIQINLLGMVRGVRTFVPSMLERGSGHVINTASLGGVLSYTWDGAAYAASKFAAYGYTEAMVRSLRPHGVDVSVLCPGLVTGTNAAETSRWSGVPKGREMEWFYLPEWLPQASRSPEEAGEIVADAVEDRRFAIFTHPDNAELFRTWRLDIEKSLTDSIAASPLPPLFH